MPVNVFVQEAEQNWKDQADDVADRMGDLLATTKGERETGNEAMIIRDLTVDEIRACGKYIFWHNPDRLKG